MSCPTVLENQDLRSLEENLYRLAVLWNVENTNRLTVPGGEENLVLWAQEENPDRPAVQGNGENPAPWAQEENPDRPAVLGNRESRDRRVLRDLRDRRALPVPWGREENRGRVVRQGLRAIRRTAYLHRFQVKGLFCRKVPIFRLKIIYRIPLVIYLSVIIALLCLPQVTMPSIIIYPQ